ncbi:hypothetical protein IV203_011386 [Nitzschia inconspicua]|uniref:Uncharacterized protein n=1 Tax=Nitzschia inconspicua TaxID=303405 RepID=A0A9K3KT28_9STRA|nr:hypothetical protein IV203_011386 [Nitzschia inconspicua]
MYGSRDPQPQPQSQERTASNGSLRWLFFVDRLVGQKKTIVIWTLLATTILWNIVHNTRVLDVSKMIPTTTVVGTTVSFSSSGNHPSNPTNSTQTTIITQQRQRQRNVSSDGIIGISIRTEEPKTLAMLYPVSLLGGYRNQAMRFFSFVHYALRNNYSQLLLPTLVWSTRYLQYHFDGTNTNTTNTATSITSSSREQDMFWPVPMEDLFDIHHWNSYRHHPYNYNSNQKQSANILLSLPILIDSISNSDCWNTTTPSLSEQEHMIHHLRDSAQFLVEIPKLTLATLPTLLRQPSPLKSATIQYVTGNISKVRRISGLMQQVQHCQHPAIRGGGLGVGTLWKDYETKIAAQQHRPEIQQFLNTVNQALRPASQWRSLAEYCLDYHLSPPSEQHGNKTNNNKIKSNKTNKNHKTNNNNHNHHHHHHHHHHKQQHNRSFGYAVLHARVESDMAGHKCGKHMERNLTKLFHWMDTLVQEYNTNVTIQDNVHDDYNDHDDHHRYPTLLRGTMVAIARGFMNPNHNNNNNDRFAVDNWYTLNDRSVSYSNQSYQFDSHNKNAQKTTTTAATTNDHVVFECGEGWLQEAFYKNPLMNHKQLPNGYYGNILPAMLDFWLAVQADVFVGVMHSSWSTDVWTTRYYQGKGRHNYQYTTTDGIIPLPNRDGLPPAHTRC